MKMLRLTFTVAAALLLITGVSTAHAQQEATGASGTLTLGKSYTLGGGTDIQHGFGLDLRYSVYPEAEMDGYLGILAQGEYQSGDAWRFVGGLQGGWDFFGLEVGISHRTETAGYAGSTGLHLGQSPETRSLVPGRLVESTVDDDALASDQLAQGHRLAG